MGANPAAHDPDALAPGAPTVALNRLQFPA